MDRRSPQPARNLDPTLQRVEQIDERVTAHLSPESLEHRFQRLFARLLRDEARPFVEPRIALSPGAVQIAPRLIEPVRAPVSHGSSAYSQRRNQSTAHSKYCMANTWWPGGRWTRNRSGAPARAYARLT